MKETLIKATLVLFELNGAKFTLEELATAEGISKKTIYKYFHSKEDLIQHSIDYIFADIERQHFEVLKKNISTFEKLIEVLNVYPTVLNVTADKLDKLQELYPKNYKSIHDHFVDKWDITFQLYDKCVEEKSLKPYDKSSFHIIMVGIFDTLIHCPNQQQLLKSIIEMIFNGLKT